MTVYNEIVQPEQITINSIYGQLTIDPLPQALKNCTGSTPMYCRREFCRTYGVCEAAKDAFVDAILHRINWDNTEIG